MRRLALVVVVAIAVTTACADGASAPSTSAVGARSMSPTAAASAASADSTRRSSDEVTEQVISHELTNDISVWTPPGEGPWPVVFLGHGGGNYQRETLHVLASALAQEGLLVFVPDLRNTDQALGERDGACSERFVAQVASQYGGDLEAPFTHAGVSFGGAGAMVGGLDEAAYGPGGTFDECFDPAPSPDVIISIVACPSGFLWRGTTFSELLPGLGNKGAYVLLIAGEDDPQCGTERVAGDVELLRAAGYRADGLVLEGASHYSVVFPLRPEVVPAMVEAIEAART